MFDACVSTCNDSNIHTVSVKLADIMQPEKPTTNCVKVIVFCKLKDLFSQEPCELVKERIESDTIYYRFGALLVDDTTGDGVTPTTATLDSKEEEEKDLISFDNDVSEPPITPAPSSSKAYSSMSPLSASFIPSSLPQPHQTPAKPSPAFTSIVRYDQPLYVMAAPYYPPPPMKVPLFRSPVQPYQTNSSTYSDFIQPPKSTKITIKSPLETMDTAPSSATSSPLNAKVKPFIPSLPPNKTMATEESKDTTAFNVNAVSFTPLSPVSSPSLQQPPLYKRPVSTAIRISKPPSSVDEQVDDSSTPLNVQAPPFTPPPSLTTTPVDDDDDDDDEEEEQLAQPTIVLNPEIVQLPSSTPIRISKPPTTPIDINAPNSAFNVKAIPFIPSTTVKPSSPTVESKANPSSQLSTKASIFTPSSHANGTSFNIHAEAFTPATTSSTSGSASSSISSTPLHSIPSSPVSTDKPTPTSDVSSLHLASEPTTRLALHPPPYSPDLINL
ncbi:hypothetical protein [Absidia glauca]|uniref:Uncharacterized protein n=1 Tax=Absidia glauca TaxID=4829 RepID=A0A163J533_ABSGL|nr:hypothetical protein [Absidia glauca]